MTTLPSVAAVPHGLPAIVVSFTANAAADTTAVPTTVAGTTDTTAAPTTETTEVNDPSPLKIVPPELFWAGGCFIALLILMRFVLYPRVSKGMAARAQYLREERQSAEEEREGARAEKQSYDGQVVFARAEASRRLDAARAQLEQERQAALGAANDRLNARRRAAVAEVEAAREAASSQLADATADVVSHAASIVLGRSPDPALVRDVVRSSMNGDGS